MLCVVLVNPSITLPVYIRGCVSDIRYQLSSNPYISLLHCDKAAAAAVIMTMDSITVFSSQFAHVKGCRHFDYDQQMIATCDLMAYRMFSGESVPVAVTSIQEQCGNCMEQYGHCMEQCGNCVEQCGHCMEQCGNCVEQCGNCNCLPYGHVCATVHGGSDHISMSGNEDQILNSNFYSSCRLVDDNAASTKLDNMLTEHCERCVVTDNHLQNTCNAHDALISLPLVDNADFLLDSGQSKVSAEGLFGDKLSSCDCSSDVSMNNNDWASSLSSGVTCSSFVSNDASEISSSSDELDTSSTSKQHGCVELPLLGCQYNIIVPQMVYTNDEKQSIQLETLPEGILDNNCTSTVIDNYCKSLALHAADSDIMNGLEVSLLTEVNLGSFVHQIVVVNSSQLVDVSIQASDDLIHLPSAEHDLIASTESLRHYKLMKQEHSRESSSLLMDTLNKMASTAYIGSSLHNVAASSVSSLGHACQKALSYVRDDIEFGSALSLRDINFKHSVCGVTTSGEDGEGSASSQLVKKCGHEAVASGNHMRNVIYMSLMIMLLLVAVKATQNLQSSLNHEGGVGIMCLAAFSVSYTFGSVLSPVVVQSFGIKMGLIGGMVVQLLYITVNMHPVVWLIVPTSFAAGLSMSVIWNSMSTYIVLLARGEAESKNKSYQHISDKFFSIFCLIYQTNLITGNLISSLILSSGSSSDKVQNDLSLTQNTDFNEVISNFSSVTGGSFSSFVFANISFGGNLATSRTENVSSHMVSAPQLARCGAQFCHYSSVNHEPNEVPLPTVYVLFAIYMALVLMAIGIAVFLLEPLVFCLSSSSRLSPILTIRNQFASFVRFSKNIKFLLTLPLLLYSAMQYMFVCSEVMMVSGLSFLQVPCCTTIVMLTTGNDVVIYLLTVYDVVICFLAGNHMIIFVLW